MGGADAGSDASRSFCEGVADGTPCGDATETACSGPDTCVAGACVQNHVAAETACGDTTDSVCNAADTCDGAGMCRSNFAPTSKACGDPTVTECDGADSCNGAGSCVANFEDASTACGDTTNTTCNLADTCDGAGTCVPNLADTDTACGDATVTTCNGADTCDGAGACLPNFAAVATACGDSTNSACSYADACDGAGTCQQNHVAANVPCGSSLDTECDDPDACDGAGACLPRFASVGAACGASGDCATGGCDGGGGCVTQSAPYGTRCYDCAAGPGVCDACRAGVCSEVQYCAESSPGLGDFVEGVATQNGAMFDVVVTHTVTLTGFGVNTPYPTPMEIYYKVGTFQGFADDPGAWTKLGAGIAGYGTSRIRTRLNLTLTAGQTYAFYVTSSESLLNVNGTVGTAVGAPVVSDANLTLLQGVGLDYPFTNGTGAVKTPRVWNGYLEYRTAETSYFPVSSVSQSYAGGVADGVMFDMTTATPTGVIRGVLNVELEAGIHDVDVYFRRGSYQGHESSDAGWVRVGGVTDVVSEGGGALTPIPLDSGGVFVPGGEVGAFYVDTHGTGLRTGTGTNVGDFAIYGTAIFVRVGNAIDADFGGVGPMAVFRGSFEAGWCF